MNKHVFQNHERIIYETAFRLISLLQHGYKYIQEEFISRIILFV